jgi:hypothetical protein
MIDALFLDWRQIHGCGDEIRRRLTAHVGHPWAANEIASEVSRLTRERWVSHCVVEVSRGGRRRRRELPAWRATVGLEDGTVLRLRPGRGGEAAGFPRGLHLPLPPDPNLGRRDPESGSG